MQDLVTADPLLNVSTCVSKADTKKKKKGTPTPPNKGENDEIVIHVSLKLVSLAN